MDFDSKSDAYEALAKAFQPELDKVLEITITLVPNKRNPQNPFRNCEFVILGGNLNERKTD